MTDSAGAQPSADPAPDTVAAGHDPGGGPPSDDSTDDTDDVEPVEVLVQLAEEGEIDPWDVDLVAATDAFLDRLEETDLRTSGRALFYAAVLLRMKSDALLDPGDDADPDPEPWEAALEGPGGGPIVDHTDDGPAGFDPVDALEAEMDRRLERKQARGSPETLDELVRELREAEQSTTPPTPRAAAGAARRRSITGRTTPGGTTPNRPPPTSPTPPTPRTSKPRSRPSGRRSRSTTTGAATRCCSRRSTTPLQRRSRRISRCFSSRTAAQSRSSRTTSSATSGSGTRRSTPTTAATQQPCTTIRRAQRQATGARLSTTTDQSTYAPISGSNSPFVDSGIAASGVLIVFASAE
mgnify:CR=1 FL=1